MSDDRTLGAIFRQAREAKGLSQERLARDLNLLESVLRSLEADVYEQLPTGQERPLARQVAERLGLDPAQFDSAWQALPGGMAEETSDPKRERLERIVMGAITAGSIGLMAWLVVPGRNLKTGALDSGPSLPNRTARPMAESHPLPPGPNVPFPVLGELVPEVPRNDQGFLVSLRAQDASGARIVAQGFDEHRTLQVSEPWMTRVKGPFTITLENAGVVTVEVGGHPIRHGQSVGEVWVGHFGDAGQWLRPKNPPELPPTAPETETEVPPEGQGN